MVINNNDGAKTMNDWQAKQQARQVAAAALHASFPYLVPAGAKVDALQAAARNIRIELKRAFPGVAFSVKSRRFSGGNAIDVRWIDGPTSQQVDEIIDRYSAGSFDGMTDCYSYARNAWTDAFGSAKYVHSARDDSDKAIASAIRSVGAQYAANLRAAGVPQPTVAGYRSGDYMRVLVVGRDDLQCLIRQVMSRRTWALAKAALPAQLVAEPA